MPEPLPSIWRASRVPLLGIGLPVAGFWGLVTYASGSPLTAWPVLVVGVLACAGFVQADWRINRAIGTFAETFGPPDEAYVAPGGDQVAEWSTEGLTVRGSTRVFTVFRLEATVDGETFPFAPRNADEAAQRVKTDLADAGPVEANG